MECRRIIWSQLDEEIAKRMVSVSPSILASMKRRWSGFDMATLEDGLADTYLQILLDRERYYAVYLEKGATAFFRLLRIMTWRRIRARSRQPSWHRQARATLLQDVHMSGGADPEQAAALAELVNRILPPLLDQSAMRFGGRHPERMKQALLHRLLTGCSDLDAAQRSGIDRALICKGRGLVQAELVRIHGGESTAADLDIGESPGQ